MPRIHRARIEVVHNNLFSRCARRQLPCPEHIEQLGHTVPVHGILVQLLLVQLVQRLIGRLLRELGEHVRLGRGERETRRVAELFGRLLQRRQQCQSEERSGQVVNLQAGLVAIRRGGPGELEDAGVEKCDVEAGQLGRAFAYGQHRVEGEEIHVPDVDCGGCRWV